MKIKKQKTCLKVQDWSDVNVGCGDGGGGEGRHGPLLPGAIRCLICGPSSCGKTNVLLTLLLDPVGMKYKTVYLFSKSLGQPKYLFLKEVYNRVNGLSFHMCSDKSEVIPPADAKCGSVIIFDDVALEDQEAIRQYFSMGRHKHLECFYLCQTYSKIPKQLVRDNANLILLFKQDDLNLKHAYEDHVNTDMPWEKFRDICRHCWVERYSFLVINKDCEINKGRYRKNFDNFIEI